MPVPSSEAVPEATGEARVMVVEDDAIVARDVERSLEVLGHRVVAVARTGEDAVDGAREERPDLVLMDIRLAGELDGIEAAGAIQGELKIPVVFLTAYADAETRERVRETEPFGYVVKPFDQRDIHTAVEVALERHRLERRLRGARNRYEALLRCMGDGLIATDADGRVEYLNPAAQALIRSMDDQVEGRSAADVLRLRDGASEEPIPSPVARALDEERVVEFGAGVELVRSDGEALPVAGSVSPVLEEGTVVGAEAVFRDLSELREAERTEAASERRYRVLFEQNVAGVFRATPEGEILEVNAALAGMFGFEDPGELEGVTADSALCSDPDDWGPLRRTLSAGGTVRNREIRARRRDGSDLWMLISASLVGGHTGEEERIVGTAVEITGRKDMEQELAELAYHDELTGLANRRMLEEKASQVLALADRGAEQAALLYLDLDGFKVVNDRHGHQVGDEVLARIGDRLAGCAREADTVARMGGDEFAVLLTGVRGGADAAEAAGRFAGQLEEPVQVEGHRLQIRGCCGVALYPDHGETFGELVSAADRAMYAAKRTEGDEVVLAGSRPAAADTASDGPAPVRQQVIRRSLAERTLLLYQPICRTRDGETVGAEGLVRWRQPDGRTLTARDFVPVIRRAGLGESLDTRVLEEVAKLLASWRDDEGPEWVAVNLTLASLRSPRLLGRLEEVLDRHRLDAGRLVLEVSEEAAAGDQGAVPERIRGLRELGVRIALDGDGGEHLSTGHLRELPLDFLKVDRSVLAEADDGGAGQELVPEELRRWEEAGTRVILKGVENAEHFARARGRGIALAQGYYSGPPSPPEVLS